MMGELWESLRPKQWTKNLFVFAGIIFSKNFLCPPLLLNSVLTFLVFCFLSGSVYVLNDIADVEEDKKHPSKSKRPIASGRLTVRKALIGCIVLSALSLMVAYAIDVHFLAVATTYLLLQLGYSYYLKNLVIVDVLVVATGFVLRVVAGALVIQVGISSWLIVCTTLLALFLALSKRRHELVLLSEMANQHRKILGEYTPYLLDQMIAVVTSATLVAYSFYTISEETVRKFGTRDLVITIPFVLYGIFRYLYLIHQKAAGESPESTLINDKPLLAAVILWVVAVGIILYG